MEAYLGDSLTMHRGAVRRLAVRQQRKLGRGRVKPPRSVEVNAEPSLPQLAWLCRIAEGKYVFTVGPGVETSTSQIFEGAWIGEFLEPSVDQSHFVYGSGATLKNQIIFVPPKHALEALFVLHDRLDRSTYVSNSLNFALSGARISVEQPFFQVLSANLNASTNIATAAGIDLYDPLVCEDARFRLDRLMYYNFMADGDGNIRIIPTSPSHAFANYAEYRDFLVSQLRGIFQNAGDTRRTFPLKPITTISKGYDSPAVAALAQEAGCEKALTLNVTVLGMNDSGAEVARALGMDVSSYHHVIGDVIPNLRFDFEGDLKQKALEFIATVGIGDDITFLPFEPELRGRVFLTGGYGDAVWDKASTLRPGLPQSIMFAKSITEFRLRVGFAFVPVACFGARFPHSIKAISNSAEMEPFSIGGGYDRPIPRRIAEEAGVPRKAFGIAKNATAPLPTNHLDLFAEAVQHVMKRYEILATA